MAAAPKESYPFFPFQVPARHGQAFDFDSSFFVSLEAEADLRGVFESPGAAFAELEEVRT